MRYNVFFVMLLCYMANGSAQWTPSILNAQKPAERIISISGEKYRKNVIMSAPAFTLSRVAVEDGKFYYTSNGDTYALSPGNSKRYSNTKSIDDISDKEEFVVSQKEANRGQIYITDNLIVKTRSMYPKFKFTHLRKEIGFLLGINTSRDSLKSAYIFDLKASLSRATKSTSEIAVHAKLFVIYGCNIIDLAIDRITGSIFVSTRSFLSFDELVLLERVDDDDASAMEPINNCPAPVTCDGNVTERGCSSNVEKLNGIVKDIAKCTEDLAKKINISVDLTKSLDAVFMAERSDNTKA